MLTLACFVCGAQVERQREKWPVLCGSLCRNRVYRTRQTVKRLRRELQEAEEQLRRWRVGVER